MRAVMCRDFGVVFCLQKICRFAFLVSKATLGWIS